MTFYGKDPEPDTPARMKRFYYTTAARPADPESIRAQHVYFYESGHVGFWNDKDGDARTLVLATKADEVWEDEE